MTDEEQRHKERAKWTRAEEASLLELWCSVRANPEFHGERGLKRAAWAWVANEMAARHGDTKEKAMIQSKFMRLIKEYKLFLWVVNMPGVTHDDQGQIVMSESAWEQVFAEKKTVELSILRKLKQVGFPLATQCAAACSDDPSAGIKTAITNLGADLSTHDVVPSDGATTPASVRMSTRSAGAASSPATTPLGAPVAAFRPHHADEFGLQPHYNKDGIVESATCRFCLTFGRDARNGKRRIGKPKSFRSFRVDNYRQHLSSQHTAKWEEFRKCENLAAKKAFFVRGATVMADDATSPVDENDGGLEEDEDDDESEVTATNGHVGAPCYRPIAPAPPSVPRATQNNKRSRDEEDSEEDNEERASRRRLKERELHLRERELALRREELAERKQQRLEDAQQREKQFGMVVEMVEKLHRTQAQLLGIIAGALGSQPSLVSQNQQQPPLHLLFHPPHARPNLSTPQPPNARRMKPSTQGTKPSPPVKPRSRRKPAVPLHMTQKMVLIVGLGMLFMASSAVLVIMTEKMHHHVRVFRSVQSSLRLHSQTELLPLSIGTPPAHFNVDEPEKAKLRHQLALSISHYAQQTSIPRGIVLPLFDDIAHLLPVVERGERGAVAAVFQQRRATDAGRGERQDLPQ
ncbi:hypothetical protein FI667_g13377, partial [Globisporangium splendens]